MHPSQIINKNKKSTQQQYNKSGYFIPNNKAMDKQRNYVFTLKQPLVQLRTICLQKLNSMYKQWLAQIAEHDDEHHNTSNLLYWQ
jgi:hypothetical protein